MLVGQHLMCILPNVGLGSVCEARFDGSGAQMPRNNAPLPFKLVWGFRAVRQRLIAS